MKIEEITLGQAWLEDQIYEWPVIRFLNRLAFLKEHNDVTEREKIFNATQRQY